MGVEEQSQRGARIEPEKPEVVQEVIEDAHEYAQENMARAEAILGQLTEETVPEKYDDEAEWAFTFTGALAHHPDLFEIWWAEEGQVFGGGNLDRGFKELLAAVIAHDQGAAICIAWHTNSAAIEEVPPERFAVAGAFDERKEDLDEAERTAIEFARRSVTAPASVTDEDVEELRRLGYSDADIVELTATAGTAAKFANFALTLDI